MQRGCNLIDEVPIRIRTAWTSPTVKLWVSDFGDFILPNDFPFAGIRKDGWFDGRKSMRHALCGYIEAQTAKLRDGTAESGFKAPSFSTWCDNLND